MDALLTDVRQTLRMLRRSPVFTLTALAALALGIGANTAIFSVVDAVLLKPLPYPDPDRIVQLVGVTPQGSFAIASVPTYNIWREQTQVLEDVAAYDNGGPGINIGGGDRPEQVKGIHVSREFFRLFGVPVPLGRPFTAEEDRPGGPKVVVISDGLWHRRFGADPNIAGKPILLGREPYTIVGVMGPGFNFTSTPDPAAAVSGRSQQHPERGLFFGRGQAQAGRGSGHGERRDGPGSAAVQAQVSRRVGSENDFRRGADSANRGARRPDGAIHFIGRRRIRAADRLRQRG
jgi:hypothetical protein